MLNHTTLLGILAALMQRKAQSEHYQEEVWVRVHAERQPMARHAAASHESNQHVIMIWRTKLL